jgi:hypothetical protein
MSFSWFAFFRDTRSAAPLDPATLDAITATIRHIPGLRQGLVMSRPTRETAHPFPDNEPSPALVLQLQFDTIEALEAAVAADGPLRPLGEAHGPNRSVTQQAMLARRYPVPDPALHTPADALPCSYLVQYPGPAADLNAWHGHYNRHHPPLMAKFPGVRAIEIYTRIDWVDGLGWAREDMMQRNKLLFDSPQALTEGLLSPVLQEMRADFNQFPPFSGGNVHYVLETRFAVAR